MEYLEHIVLAVHVHLPSNPDDITALYSVLQVLMMLYNPTLPFLLVYPILATSLLFRLPGFLVGKKLITPK